MYKRQVLGYGFGLFGGSVGVLRKQGKDSSLVKIVPQLTGCDRLRPVRREVGKPPPALLDEMCIRDRYAA